MSDEEAECSTERKPPRLRRSNHFNHNNNSTRGQNVRPEKRFEQLESQKRLLIQELKIIEDSHLNETDDEMELLLEEQIRSKEIEIDKLSKQIHGIQSEIKRRFMNNAFNIRKKNSPISNTYKIACKDAEDTVFDMVAVPSETIAFFFSTGDNIIDCTQFGDVLPSKLSYSWFLNLFKRENNVIPLSPGIETPQKQLSNGNFVNVTFFVEYFLNNKTFIKRCRDYYKNYFIDFIIKKDKKKKKHYTIILNVSPSGIRFC